MATIALGLHPAPSSNAAPLQVTGPPGSFFHLVEDGDRDAARAFYGKYIDVNGMPAVAAGLLLVVFSRILRRPPDLR